MLKTGKMKEKIRIIIHQVMKGTYNPCDILDEEDRIVRSAMRTWVESNLSETRREIDEDWNKHEIADDLLGELLTDLTYQIAFLPEKYDGVGWESMVRGCVALEEANRAPLSRHRPGRDCAERSLEQVS